MPRNEPLSGAPVDEIAPASRRIPGLPDPVASLLVLQRIEAAGRTWQLWGIPDWDALLLELMARELDTIPFWAGLWESAVGMAEWLHGHADVVRGRRVLELGCGLGLAGLVASRLGARVTQTDLYPEALCVAAENARLNGLDPLPGFAGDWRDWTHPDTYDILLGTDILYERAVFAELLGVLRQSLAPGGRILLGDPMRAGAAEFLDARAAEGWRVAFHHQDFAWHGHPGSIAVFDLEPPA